MKHRTPFLFLVVVVLLNAAPTHASIIRNWGLLDRTNKKLKGRVLDFTRNHGKDHRIWSDALKQKRDLYVYVPPCYDPDKCYPLLIWLHGYAQDETSFLQYVVGPLDRAIRAGVIPPMIVAAPDGTFTGSPCVMNAGTFFLNTKAGRFADFLMCDVWNYLHKHFPILPEREAHVIAGVSMGGNAAFTKAIQNRDRIKTVMTVYPPLNTRYTSCRDRYMDDFDPNCWKYRTDYTRRFEVVGRFYGVVTFRLGQLTRPLYDIGPKTAFQISQTNPIELLDRLDLRPGELSMFIAYGGKDQFNIDAQIESFLYVARKRGLRPTVVYDPNGRHDLRTALQFVEPALEWLGKEMAAYK